MVFGGVSVLIWYCVVGVVLVFLIVMFFCCWCVFVVSCGGCSWIWLGFAAEFCLWLLYLLPVVVVVGFHFRHLIGCRYWYFFRFGSSISLLSSVCNNRTCLCYSLP